MIWIASSAPNERAREAGLGVKRKADLYDFRASLTKRIIRGRTGVLKNPRTVPYIRNHIRP